MIPVFHFTRASTKRPLTIVGTGFLIEPSTPNPTDENPGGATIQILASSERIRVVETYEQFMKLGEAPMVAPPAPPVLKI